MLSFGWSEIALTAIIVVIVVGPKEIPNLLRQVGKFSKSIKKISREFKSSINDLAEEGDIKDIKNSISYLNKMKDGLNPTKALNQELNDEIKSIKNTIGSIDKDLSEINSKDKDLSKINSIDKKN